MANEKPYVNREEGFIGTDMKKDEFVCNCSNIDDIIVFQGWHLQGGEGERKDVCRQGDPHLNVQA